MPQIPVRTGITMNYEITGSGEPLLLIMGTTGSIPLWGEFRAGFEGKYQVIAFDNRGLGGRARRRTYLSRLAGRGRFRSARGIEIPSRARARMVLGLGDRAGTGAGAPEQVASAVMYATWSACDGYQRSLLSAPRLPYVHRDFETAMTATDSPIRRRCSTDRIWRSHGAVPPVPAADGGADAGDRRAVGRGPRIRFARSIPAITAPTVVVENRICSPHRVRRRRSPMRSPGPASNSSPGPAPAMHCTSNGPRTC